MIRVIRHIRHLFVFLLIAVAGLSVNVLTGCTRASESSKPPIHLNPNMDAQEKYEPQEASLFFEDGAAMRVPVEGTVARGELREDVVYYTGKDKSGTPVEVNPVEVTEALLTRGEERFNIFCAPCHSRLGDGKGIVIEKGFTKPPTFHVDSIKTMPDGHYFDVITNGIRNMPSYHQQVPVADRWAIVAFIRKLQQNYVPPIEDNKKDTLK